MTMAGGMLGWNARGATVSAAAGLLPLFLTLAAGPIGAQTPGEPMTFTRENAALFFENDRYRFNVTFPKGCRYEEGPGTLDAICAPDFDAEKSATIGKAGALVLSFVHEDIDTTAASVQERFTEAAFKADLPESVCGEPDPARARIEKLDRRAEYGVVNQSADVVCAEVKFLRIGERRASVVQTIAPHGVFRLTARAPTEEFEKRDAAISEFFSSFNQGFTAHPDKRQPAMEAGKR
jgi:hypothetical protein